MRRAGNRVTRCGLRRLTEKDEDALWRPCVTPVTKVIGKGEEGE